MKSCLVPKAKSIIKETIMDDIKTPLEGKFEQYKEHGISAPQVLLFLDQMSMMLKHMTNDIDGAVYAITSNIEVPTPKQKEAAKEIMEESTKDSE
jgi:hypothetical protein